MNNQELTIKIEVAHMTKSDSAKVQIKLGGFPAVADHNAVIDLSGDDSTITDLAIDSLRLADAQILNEAVDACNSLIIAITQAQGAQREAQLDRDAIDQQQRIQAEKHEYSHAGEHGGNPEGEAIS